MELTAVIKACNKLKEIDNECAAYIYSDSAYIINCYKQKWWEKWELNGWVNSKKQTVANRDLWEQILVFFKNLDKFSFNKVAGHNSLDTPEGYWNDYVDKMAVYARTNKQSKSKVIVIVVNGYPGSGKTTMELAIKNYLENKIPVYIHSSIQDIKEIATLIGWDGTKDEKSRKFLSDLKKLLNDYNDFTLQKLNKFYNILKTKHRESLLFIDCREPEEIDKLVKKFDAVTLCIKRSSCENLNFSNDSDKNVNNYNYDYYIYNNETIDNFKENSIKTILEIYNKSK